MSTPAADELAKFKIASDRAFADMKAQTDQAMANFLQSYSSANPVSVAPQASVAPRASTPPLASPPAPKSPVQPLRSEAQDSLKKAMEMGESLMQNVTPTQMPALDKAHISDSADDLFNDFSQLGMQAKTDVHNTAKEALKGTSDILKGAGADLGQRAKSEAAALRDAARRAVEEERSLKALRNRAQEELSSAKKRLQSQAEEAKASAFAKFQNLAQSKANELKEAASQSLEAGQQSLQRELDDLISGEDTPQ